MDEEDIAACIKALAKSLAKVIAKRPLEQRTAMIQKLLENLGNHVDQEDDSLTYIS